MYFEAAETDSGYQHIQITPGNALDLRYYPYDGGWESDGYDNGARAGIW